MKRDHLRTTGRRIRALRIATGASQADIAAAIGLSRLTGQPAVSQAERGGSAPWNTKRVAQAVRQRYRFATAAAREARRAAIAERKRLDLARFLVPTGVPFPHEPEGAINGPLGWLIAEAACAVWDAGAEDEAVLLQELRESPLPYALTYVLADCTKVIDFEGRPGQRADAAMAALEQFAGVPKGAVLDAMMDEGPYPPDAFIDR